MRVSKKGECSNSYSNNSNNNNNNNNSRKRKVHFKRNVVNERASSTNEIDARCHATFETSRFRWSRDLHNRFTSAITMLGGEDEAIKDAEEKGIDTSYIAKLPELVSSVPRVFRRRQTRLERIKIGLGAYFSTESQPDGIDNLHDNDDEDDQDDADADDNVTVVKMPDEDGKKSHSYLMFNELINNPNPINSADYKKSNEKGKAKMVYPKSEGITINEPRTRKSEASYNEAVKRCKTSISDPKLSDLEMPDQKLKLTLGMASPSLSLPSANSDELSLKLAL